MGANQKASGYTVADHPSIRPRRFPRTTDTVLFQIGWRKRGEGALGVLVPEMIFLFHLDSQNLCHEKEMTLAVAMPKANGTRGKYTAETTPTHTPRGLCWRYDIVEAQATDI